MNKKRLSILSEEVVRREDLAGPIDDDSIENPYWAEEEAEPRDPTEKGCIRRGLCCKSSPGWFAPGEVEAAAESLAMTPDAFVRTYLVIDSLALSPNEPEIHVFVPVKLGRDGAPLRQPGTKVDRLYRMFRGPCVFYEGGGCKIYKSRPLECQRYICTNEPSENISHEEIAALWRDGVSSQSGQAPSE